MEATTDRLPAAYAFSDGHPTSPPMTPSSRLHTQPRFPPQTSQTSPMYRKMEFAKLAQSPPLDSIEPIENGPRFNFTRSRAQGTSSRPSSACATTPQDSGEDDDADDESGSDHESSLPYVHQPRQQRQQQQRPGPSRHIDEADVTFILEELNSSDSNYDSSVEVVHPDHFSDAKSERSSSFLSKFKEMQVLEDFTSASSSSERERERRYLRKKKRWSAGIFKRTHSQSIEGDSSYSDNDPHDDVDSTARRLRRRVRGPTLDRRASLDFEDRGFSNSNNIAEVEEPEEGWILHSKGPPSIPSDDAFTLDELPFWEVEETESVGPEEENMVIEYESS